MNLNEIKTEIRGLENFAFETITPATASTIVYGDDKYLEEFRKPGLYCVRSGCRGIIEHVELVGSSIESLNIPTLNEAIASFSEDGNEEDLQTIEEYVAEYYMVTEDTEYPGVLNFGFTEEEFDYYFLVN